ncbi:MAG: Mu transposase domain-containing protein [Candidatus Methanoculleus thermohydrogenotrophicum]
MIRREEHRKISKEAFVSYLGNRYSVPYRYAGQDAILELQDDRISIRVRAEGHLFTHDRSRPWQGR